ncbi:hypothetical protein EBF04_25950 [Streptomyces sp. I6]|nr:hypothetical protein EBF04_25950 [Streptomyces sp. I6]
MAALSGARPGPPVPRGPSPTVMTSRVIDPFAPPRHRECTGYRAAHSARYPARNRNRNRTRTRARAHAHGFGSDLDLYLDGG